MVRWPLQPLQPLQKTQLQPPVGSSVDSLCHPWFTTSNLSYRLPIFETSAAALRGTTGIPQGKLCNIDVETGNLYGFPMKMIYIHGGFSTFLLVYRRASWISGHIGSFPTILRTPWFWQHWNSSQKTYGFPLFHPLFSPNNGDFSEVVIISLLASTLPLGTKLAALHWIRWLLC